MIDQITVQKCLDAIEEQEMKLLSWGDTNFRHTKQEILELITSQTNESADVLFDKLINQCLLLSVADVFFDDAYRTRMSETVRLSKMLRQWFHKQKLKNTKTLVSDFRFIRRPRRYPKRDIPSNQAISQLCESLAPKEKYKEAFEAILGSDNKLKLSGFQIRATERILKRYSPSVQKSRKVTATIVCSGTGSGKTLSFYLPALTQLSLDLIKDPSERVRILAIYPRKELLKDQFQETFNQARLMDSFLTKKGCRKIRIGTFFGDTFNGKYLDKEMAKGGAAYELLRCSCSGEFKWLKEDFQVKREVVTCNKCKKQIGSEEISLTRQSPSPDILFTTTEMLNQHLGNSNFNHLFGVKKHQSIPLVLLDEVHTYEGSTGAQTAYLLRRWMKRSNSKPHFVGLSATLNNASSFFAALTGTHKNLVEKIEPLESETLEEGAEYLLALRGDPVSQTALLSTTIQTIMLFKRMLDNKHNVSSGTFGRKSFVFTDDLDVNNRLFEMMADAEGWDHSYSKMTPTKEPLAFLRSPKHPDYYDNKEQMALLGQDWSNAEYIGHALDENDRAIVSRTSSQDSGVNENADIVIATASLEVGFNDPLVGAVIQHKAPRGMASYVQRKGRAGRSRGMRPWMITVLSDYGRDRIAFQRYESLIDPEIKANKLPIDNAHIQKMQAALATLDWLSAKIGIGNMWWGLKNANKIENSPTYDKLIRHVEDLNSNKLVIDEFRNYLTSALQLDQETIERLFWQGPRSLRMDFLPSLLQKLDTHWAENGRKWAGLSKDDSPMPEFFPATLFKELILPSLNISLLRGKKEDRIIDWENLGFFQGLKEFAPGRISKRYSINTKYESDWLVPKEFAPEPNSTVKTNFEITEAFGPNLQPLKQVVADGEELEVFKPVEIFTQRLETQTISETSNAFLKWKSDFFVELDSHQMPIPKSSEWYGYLNNICFFQHNQMCPIELTRYTLGANATIKFKKGEPCQTDFDWVNGPKKAGVGTLLFVDGVRFEYIFTDQDLQKLMQEKEVLQSVRYAFVEDLFLNSTLFKNKFQASWVFDCVTTAIFYISIKRNESINAVIEGLTKPEYIEIINNVPLELFQLNQIDIDESEEQVLQKDILQFLSSKDCLTALKPLLKNLVDDLENPRFLLWLRALLSNTLSGGLNALLGTLLPDIAEQDLNIDSSWYGDKLTIWVSENEAGGVGIINRFEELYVSDPLNVLNHLTRSFQIGEYEQVNYDIHLLLKTLDQEQEMVSIFETARKANSYNKRLEAVNSIRSSLKSLGLTQTHSFNSILHTRMLKPGSSEQSDKEMLEWLDFWNQTEQKLQIEIPLVAISYLIVKHIEEISPEHANTRKDKVISQLWPRGNTIRQTSIQFYNKFVSSPQKTERLIIEKLIDDRIDFITFGPDWKAHLENIFSHKNKGKAEIRFAYSDLSKLNSTIYELNTLAIDYLGMLFHLRVSKINRQKDSLSVFLEIAETIQ